MRLLQWTLSNLERLLLGVGTIALGYFLYATAESMLYQAFENRELEAILAEPAPPRQPDRQRNGQPGRGGDATRRTIPAKRSVVGRIEIPRLEVAAVVRAGSDARTLQLAVGHIPGTALPGEAGNVGLAAHRDTFFRRLRDIRSDDEIRIATPGATYIYRVARTDVVEPSDVWVLDPTPHPSLTLVTCYPFSYVGSAPQRFIVRAELIRVATTFAKSS